MTMTSCDHTLTPPLLSISMLRFSFCAYSYILFSFLKLDTSKNFLIWMQRDVYCQVINSIYINSLKEVLKTDFNKSEKWVVFHFFHLLFWHFSFQEN